MCAASINNHAKFRKSVISGSNWQHENIVDAVTRLMKIEIRQEVKVVTSVDLSIQFLIMNRHSSYPMGTISRCIDESARDVELLGECNSTVLSILLNCHEPNFLGLR